MNFPLDIIWINGNKIVDISKNIQAPKNTGRLPVIISPSTKIDKVLELSAGAVEKFNIKIGDEIKILNSHRLFALPKEFVIILICLKKRKNF